MAETFAQISVRGAKKVANDFRRDGEKAAAQTYAVTRQYTQLLTTSVKKHASGRPGPRAPTGDYRRSITGEVERRESGAVIGTVGTSKPQGRRLEMGFVGMDRLGRHYHQSPFPHFRPALSKIEGAYRSSLEGIVKRL